MITLNETDKKAFNFITDTLLHFNSTNRGFDNEKTECSYVSGCAIGRHIEDKELCKELDLLGSINSEENLDGVVPLLPEKLQEIPHNVLYNMQNLHDNADLWDETGFKGSIKNITRNRYSDSLNQALCEFFHSTYVIGHLQD